MHLITFIYGGALRMHECFVIKQSEKHFYFFKHALSPDYKSSNTFCISSFVARSSENAVAPPAAVPSFNA